MIVFSSRSKTMALSGVQDDGSIRLPSVASTRIKIEVTVSVTVSQSQFQADFYCILIASSGSKRA